MARTHGLTESQRDKIICAIRPTTCVKGAKGYPARRSDVGEPASATEVEWWTDAGRFGAAFASQGDVTAYDGAGVVFEEANSESMHNIASVGLVDGNLSYFEHLQTSGWTLAMRVRSVTLGSNEVDPLFGTGWGSGSDVGLETQIQDDSGTPFIAADLSDGSGSDIWSCSATNSDPISLSGSGFDELGISQDDSAKTLAVSWNRSEIFTAGGFSLMASGTAPSGPVTLAHDGGTAFADIVVEGLFIYQEPDHVEPALNWIAGDDFLP